MRARAGHARRGGGAMGMTFARETSARLETSPPAHDARDLTRGGGLAHIMLDGQLYTLRITRAGKLILTK